MRALVVDDVLVNRRLATLLLRNAGWETEEAGNGEQALALLGSRHFDAVLLDIAMPGMSGHDVCERLCGDERHDRTRIIAYSAHIRPEDTDYLHSIGYDAVLPKPIDRAALLAALAG